MIANLVLALCLLLFWAGLIFFGLVRMRTLLAYFQQEEYDAARFLAAWRTMRLFDVLASILLLAGFVFALEGVGGEALLVLMALASFLIARREARYKFKKPLNMTERAMRLYRLALGLAGLWFAITLVLAALVSPRVASQLFLAVLIVQLLPLALIAAGLLIAPSEAARNQAFIDEASQKLAGFAGLRIGITGSFGKTSVKHMLAQLLALDGPVFFSRGSINTLLGLTRHIRQRLQPAHKYFIAEMGAYRKGSIARLADFVQPEIGIVTAVGEAHLERFGSLEATAAAKAELADYVCAHGRLVVVTEAVAALAPFAALRQRYPDKFVVCGESADCDVRLVSTALSEAGRRIEVDLGGQTLALTLPLIGAYNALNLCLCLAVIRAVAPDILPFVPGAAAELEQVPHRLEKKESVSGPLVLDDAYNANQAGMREAVSVAQTLARQRGGKAVMITPGIVELGETHEAVHRALGEWAGGHCDVVHVVNPTRIPSFVAGAKAAAHAKVETHQSLAEARKALAVAAPGARDVVLYANDLPDVLEEKRFL